MRQLAGRPARGVVLVACLVGSVVDGEALPVHAELDRSPRVECCQVIPAVELPGGVRLGGLSDLFVTPADEGSLVAWTLTDRGPNGTVGNGDAKRRTLLAPDFAPTIIKLRVATGGDAGGEFAAPVLEATLPLRGLSGRPASGRPNGIGRDEPILDAETGAALAADHAGIDPEGLVVMPAGSFWATEEYRPSLLRITASGKVIERHVPAGVTLPDADARVIADLPACYGDRRDNRGFEGLAISADARRLFLLLQSPLDHPAKGAGKQTGNVRLLVVDADTGSPIAEHVYRLGDPAEPGWATAGAPPEDGKLCGLAALADGSLLALEQADGGLARLYRVDPAVATDTLPATISGEGEALEAVADLAAAGIRPLPKTLVADLAPLLPQIRTDIGHPADAAVKLEGLAVLDERRVMLVNDNDFGVTADPGQPSPRSCLWIVTLPADLSAGETIQGRHPR